VDHEFKRPRLPASGIAYIFYRNLAGEKLKYAGIRTIVVNKSGVENTFDFPMDSLEIVNSYYPRVEKAALSIGKSDFTALGSQFNPAFDTAKKAVMLSNIAKLQPEYGPVKMVLPAGFAFYEADGSIRLHIAAAVVREKQNHPFSVDVDLSSPGDRIEMLNYEY